MEYDNDRPVKPVYKTEIFYWILIFLFYPLITYFTFFYKHLVFLPILLLISLLLFPCYLFYAKAIIPLFAFTKRYVWFGLISVAFYILVIAFIKLIYSFFNLYEQVLK
jgi:hypothetical protein